ncbi:MAG: acyl carrier protein [Acholeplasma sp.]|nr:acyl carrier protein [Acholeplasma sp.]
MEINEFIKHFADQFDDTDPNEITAQTIFHDLEEWSSLIALSIINMTEKKCSVSLSFDDVKSSVTVQDVFDLIKSKQ